MENTLLENTFRKIAHKEFRFQFSEADIAKAVAFSRTVGVLEVLGSFDAVREIAVDCLDCIAKGL